MDDFIMDRRKLLIYLTKLNEVLKQDNEQLELWISGGANRCLFIQSRESTHDIDAYTKQIELLIRKSKQLSQLFNLPVGWLNPSADLFVTESMCKDSVNGPQYSNLTVHFLNWRPMLVLKVVAGRDRDEYHDFSDAVAIMRKYKVDSAQQISEWIDFYMPGWNNPFVMKFATDAWNEANDRFSASSQPPV